LGGANTKGLLKMATATKGFRRALLSAASQARDEGKITGWELFRIRTVAALVPGKLREAQDTVMDQACASGLMSDGAGDAEAFDWAALLDFIKELLPIILQIIAIF
jgi:hypothetical protein